MEEENGREGFLSQFVSPFLFSSPSIFIFFGTPCIFLTINIHSKYLQLVCKVRRDSVSPFLLSSSLFHKLVFSYNRFIFIFNIKVIICFNQDYH